MKTLARNWKSASLLTAVVVALIALLLAASDSARVQAQTPDDEALKYQNMDPLLNEIVQQYEMEAVSASAAATNAPVNSGGSVVVVVFTDSGEAEEVRDFLLENGASPGPVFEDFVAAEVPVSLLARASQQDGVTWMEVSLPPRVAEGDPPEHVEGEHGEDVWHAAGLKGEGVKVGIISHNFAGFEESMGTSLPAAIEVRCYVGFGVFSTNLQHCTGRHRDAVGPGTIATEAVYSIAPEATYYVAHVRSQTDLLAAVRWMIESDVDVINSSLSWTWSGPGDGTSPLVLSDLNSVEEAIEAGITWVASAGNDATATWYGEFDDEDGNGFHNFVADGDDECNRVDIEPNEFYMALLRWDDTWFDQRDENSPEPTELEIKLVNEETSATLRTSYSRYWSRVARAPIEYLYFGNYGVTDRTYCLQVEHVGGEAPDWIQLQSFFGEELEHFTSNGSISSPAESANPGLISVGIASLADPNVIWEHSSQGPTPDGRLKPEVVGGQHEGEAVIHGVEGEEYMPGTGHESAHVAGLAVLVKQRFPEFAPSDVAAYLKDTAEDRGKPGADNTWGHGYAYLPASDVADSPDPDACIQKIYGNTTVEGAWDDTCLSENRPDDEFGPGNGDYHARFYTITLGEERRVTINLSSEVDTFLYLMKGAGKDGTIEAFNDDVRVNVDLNSRIVFSNLEAGEYTIEATTFHPDTDGSFTLDVEIADANLEPAPSAIGPFRTFSRGTDHVCALRNDRSIACWGDDDHGQASPPSGRYWIISSGENGSCALRSDDAAVCWGSFSVNPSDDHTALGPFDDISRGKDHACALGEDGAITCWGSDRHGRATPPSGEFIAIGSHEGGSCALREDGALVCWGGVEVSP